MSFLAPIFFVGLAAIAVPVLIHLIQRERKEVVHFPSLMFLRRIPYQSVQRRKIHNWLLLLLRCAAIGLLVLAFARPFLTQDPSRLVAASEGAREVVILLDHSASMGYGDHWERARAAARKVVSGLGGGDRATLVLFATGEEEALRATSNRAALDEAIGAAKVTSDATRYGPALRYAQSLLSRSPLPRKEAVLISDFQKTGWTQHEEIHLPEGATLTPISVVSPGTSNVWVSKADFAREPFSGAERVSVTVLLTNRGASAVARLPVRLEIDGHDVETRSLDLESNSSGSVTFAPVTIADANMRGVVRAGSDQLPADNAFYFVLSPSRPVSVLVVDANGAPAESSLFLTTALAQGRAPVFHTDVVALSRVTAASFERRSVVVLNDVAGVPDSTTALLKQFVEQGGGLFVVVAERTPWAASEAALLPGRLGAMVDRPVVQGRLGTVEYSHPVFEIFQQPRNGDSEVRAVLPIPDAGAGRDRRGPGALRRWRGRDGGAARRRRTRDRVHVEPGYVLESPAARARVRPARPALVPLSGAVRGAGGVVHRRSHARRVRAGRAARARGRRRGARRDATPAERRRRVAIR